MRAILHCDMNSFYASVEQAEHPELRGKPVIVGGDEASRHGIVLTASYPAKHRGVKTAMTLGQARRVCPEAIIVPPHYDLYQRYARLARTIYYEYSDLVEPFGLDEAWIDVTDSVGLFGGDVPLLAREISERLRSELGLGASVGVSWNKVFAKFGSDHDKPDGYLVVTPENYRQVVWPAPVGDLLYVGPATTHKLLQMGISTIGDLANAETWHVRGRLGVVGEMLVAFARGLDASPVKPLDLALMDADREVKSVGNGVTMPFDARDPQTARQVIWILGESVAQRLRALGLEASCVDVSARSADFTSCATRQTRLARPSNITREICATAFRLLEENWPLDAAHPLRALHVRASALTRQASSAQLDLFGEQERRMALGRLDRTIDDLRRRFGNDCVRRASELTDPRLATLDPQRDHTIHPVGYLHGAAGSSAAGVAGTLDRPRGPG